MNASRAIVPVLDTDNGWLTVAAFELEYDSPFWLAPPIYCGNRLSSYGSNITYSVTWVVMRGDTSGEPTTGPNLILVVSIQQHVNDNTSKKKFQRVERETEITLMLIIRYDRLRCLR